MQKVRKLYRKRMAEPRFELHTKSRVLPYVFYTNIPRFETLQTLRGPETGCDIKIYRAKFRLINYFEI